MYHPILDKYWKIILYSLLWILLGLLNFWFLTKVALLDSNLSLAESIINPIILYIFNLGLWFFLRFNRFEEKSNFVLLKNVFLVGLIILVIWQTICWLLMLFISGNDEFYNNVFFQYIWIKLISGAILYFFVLLFYYLTIYYQNNKENLKRKNELSVLLKEQELTNLKQQINPHFLFNSLNSISYLIYSNPDDAHNSIVKLADYFRYSLKIGQNQVTTLNEEIENITRYLEIEKIRFSSKMEIIKNIDQNCLQYPIPVMLLQPLAENAVKHGVYESTTKIKIEINISDFDDYFTISIKNNFDIDAKPKKGTGLGLRNINQRLNLVYCREDLVKIIKTDNNYEIKLSIPKFIES